MASKQIDLTNPRLGSELLENPKGVFPLDVWETYCLKPFSHLGLYPLPVLSWRVDPSTVALAPQDAVDEALTWAIQTLVLLKSDQSAEAIEPAQRAVNTLARGSSFVQPKRGQPAAMRPIAVRAWVIRKFNPHPKKPSESTVLWSKLADLLFLEDGRCPRSIRDDEGTTICGVPRHQYDSPCVKALTTAVRNLESAMKHDGIPL
jgi:hypothetical protein